MNEVANDILMHYGMPRRSGRYPWGSGDNPYQHSSDFLSRVEELKKQGFTEKEISDSMGISTTQLRAYKSIANAERRADLVATAKGLREKGYSYNEIAEKMGYKNDSSVRSLLNEGSENRMHQAQKTADFLKSICDEKGMLDVGDGVERELGNISKEKLNQALEILRAEGYEVYGRSVAQVTNPGMQTHLKVLCPPGTKPNDIYKDDSKIYSVVDYEKILTEDGTVVRNAFEYPASLDSSRLQIRYGDQGGSEKDGVIELRRGVNDISLGDSHYAQVRILVDGTHYLKGMALYSDNLPDGVDVIFNTNKKEGTPMTDVLKKIKDDPANPFGALIKEHGGQSYYDDSNGKFIDPITGKKQSLSLINKTREEGDWGEWSKKLPSQFLSKQRQELIDKQLYLSKADKMAEFEEIKSLTNPTIKRSLLYSFADDCDSAAVHLQAAALPRQRYQVILPLNDISDREVYAPNYRNGEQVALIRYPHGGTFEIPILTVNNKIQEGNDILGKSNKIDAVGINSKVAARLSGADFDGDTVMVIPTGGKININSTHALKGLEGFDPKTAYGPPPGADLKNLPYKTMKNTQNEMGKISNLITDMTIKGAKEDEICRAVKHSMVVIDAEKHSLDYKKSYEDNGIAALKKAYQGRVENGKYTESASTLISRAKAQTSVLKRQGSPRINEDGTLSYKLADDLTYVNKKGKTITKMQKSTQMAETNDAFTLSTGTKQENAYASYANSMKSLANQARKEALNTGRLKYSPTANKTYQKEVSSLNVQLNNAEKNKPRERRAQLIANSKIKVLKEDNPNISTKDLKKASQQQLTAARLKTGSKRNPITISDKEWEAIQAGAISDQKLTKILKYADKEDLRKRATPRSNNSLSQAKQNKISAMAASGYTNAEIAEALGVSTSTVSKYLK